MSQKYHQELDNKTKQEQIEYINSLAEVENPLNRRFCGFCSRYFWNN